MSCSTTSRLVCAIVVLICLSLGAALAALADEPAAEANAKDPIPEAERAGIEAFVNAHIAHANEGDIEAYMADFIPEHAEAGLIRAHAERVSAQHEPVIEVLEIEVMTYRRDSAKVRVAQRTRWSDEGQERLDLAELRYSLRKVDGAWRIVGTTRERLL